MLIRTLQVLAVVITAAIMWAFREAFLSLQTYFSADFPIGFVCGGAFVLLAIGFIMWIDPSSRPRGNASHQQRPHDGI